MNDADVEARLEGMCRIVQDARLTTLKTIAEIYGISPERVRKIIQKNNLFKERRPGKTGQCVDCNKVMPPDSPTMVCDPCKIIRNTLHFVCVGCEHPFTVYAPQVRFNSRRGQAMPQFCSHSCWGRVMGRKSRPYKTQAITTTRALRIKEMIKAQPDISSATMSGILGISSGAVCKIIKTRNLPRTTGMKSRQH